MSPINRIEVIGIFLSVVVMAIVLAFVRFDSSNLALDLPDGASQTASLVTAVDEANPNQQAALADAIVSAAPGADLKSLIIDDIVIGEGAEVKKGDTIAVHYIGRLQNGQEFDNSYTRGTPFTFGVGAGRVIQGWDEGVVGMKVDGQRVLVIPSDMAYGDSGFGPIPGGANLVFAIELLQIQ